MAKDKAADKVTATDAPPKPDPKWETEDALSVLTRAYEVIKDKDLMARVKVLAGEKSEEMADISGKMGALARLGLVSDKAAARATETA